MFMYVFELVCLFPSDKYPEVELLSNTVVLFLIFLYNLCIIFHSSVQSLSGVWLFATPWTAPRQASLSITNSQSLLKLMSIESVVPSNHLILCHPLFLPHFNLSQHQGLSPMSRFFVSGGQSIGVSASASVLPMYTQDWSPLGWTGWIALQSKWLSR